MLDIAPASPNVMISWLSVFTTNFVLQESAALSPASWTAVTNAPVDDGTRITVTLPAGPGNQFFQLKK